MDSDVERVRRVHSNIFSQMVRYKNVLVHLSAQATNLYEEHKKGNSDVTAEIHNSFPPLRGARSRKRSEMIMAYDFSLSDAKLTIAREHQFEDWLEVEEKGNKQFNPLFEKMVDAIIGGNLDLLRNGLRSNAGLLSERSPYNHGATLLHYTGSNGVEIRRQIVPPNLLEITEFLLVSGADVNATAWCYERQMTTFRLARSSAHPRSAGIKDELLELLVKHGAIKSR